MFIYVIQVLAYSVLTTLGILKQCLWAYIIIDTSKTVSIPPPPPSGLFTQSDVQSMVSEITKMQEFHHPHVMPLIGVCLDAGPGVSMVMPYMTNGSLLDYLKKERSALELAEGEDSEKVYLNSMPNHSLTTMKPVYN